MEEIKGTYFGNWWRPEEPENKVFGILQVDGANDIYLLVQDAFEPDKIDVFSGEWPKYEVVFGLATSKEANEDFSFKLFPILQVGSRHQVYKKNRFKVSHLAIGRANVHETSHTYTRVAVYSDPWSRWLKIRGIKRKFTGHNDEHFGVEYSYTQPKPIELYRDDSQCVYIYFRGSTSESIKGRVQIIDEPFLNWEFRTPISIDDCFHNRLVMERFYMVFWERKHAFEKFEVLSTEHTNFSIATQEIVSNQFVSPQIKFSDFRQNSQEYFSKWFHLSSELELALNTFFFAFNEIEMDIENEFLSYVFALELYHRKRVRDRQPLYSRKQKLYDEVQALRKSNFKDRLMKYFQAERDISIDERIVELLGKVENKAGINLTKKLVERIKYTRHFLVHLDKKHEANRLNATELVSINQSLSMLMLRLLKQEIVPASNLETNTIEN